MIRLAAFAAAALLLASPVLAQEEEVYANIENVQGDADGFFELFSILQDAVMFGDPTTISPSTSGATRLTASCRLVVA